MIPMSRYPQTSIQGRNIEHLMDSNLSRLQHRNTYEVNLTLPNRGIPEKPMDKKHLDSQNRTVQNNVHNNRPGTYSTPIKDDSAGKGTLSNMLDKTEGELNALRRQFENNSAGLQDSRSMLDTLNTAKHQVENLKSTAEKVNLNLIA